MVWIILAGMDTIKHIKSNEVIWKKTAAGTKIDKQKPMIHGKIFLETNSSENNLLFIQNATVLHISALYLHRWTNGPVVTLLQFKDYLVILRSEMFYLERERERETESL